MGREFYLDEEYYDKGRVKISHLPDLESDWLDPVAAAEHNCIERTACWERTNTVLLRAQSGNVLMHAFPTCIKLSSKSRIKLHVELG